MTVSTALGGVGKKTHPLCVKTRRFQVRVQKLGLSAVADSGNDLRIK